MLLSVPLVYRRRVMPGMRAQAHWTQSLTLAVAGLLLGRLLWNVSCAWPFSTDDAYVPLRYAQHWAEGEGLVWNPGEAPVEGYSSFTYLVLATLSIVAGLPPMLVLKVVGVLSLMVCCLLTWRLACHFVNRSVACIAPALFSATKGSIWWSVSGLETLFYGALALGSVFCFLRNWTRQGKRVMPARRCSTWLVSSAVLAALAAMTRPEGPIIGAALVAVGGIQLLIMARQEGRDSGARLLLKLGLRDLALFSLIFSLIFGAYFLWRYDYYGRLFANTVYCKHGTGHQDSVLLQDYAALAWPALALGLVALRRATRDIRLAHFLVLPVVYALLLFEASPIIGYHHRHALLAYALLTSLAAVGVGSLCDWLGAQHVLRLQAQRVQALTLLALWGLTLAFSWSLSASVKESAENYRKRMSTRARVVSWINEHNPENEAWSTPDTGLMGTLSKSPVLDAMCLNCKEATISPISLDLGRYAFWLLLQRPKYLVPVVNDRHDISSGWAMHALKDSAIFHRFYREVAFFPTSQPNFGYAVYERLDPFQNVPLTMQSTHKWSGGPE